MDPHPSDGILEALKQGFDGTAFKQTLRDAWDRVTGSATPESDHQKFVDSQNQQANAQRTQDATNSFISPNTAAKIRMKASGR